MVVVYVENMLLGPSMYYLSLSNRLRKVTMKLAERAGWWS